MSLPGQGRIIDVNAPLWPVNVHSTEIDGRPAFETNDLMIEHPINPAYFKVLGRADDQIILSTGEKVCCIVLIWTTAQWFVAQFHPLADQPRPYGYVGTDILSLIL